MTLDASGNLLVGTTSASGKITCAVASSGTFQGAFVATNAVDSDLTIRIRNGVSDIRNSVGALSFTTDATERARITSGGELLVGLTSATGVAKLQVSGAIRTTGFTVATLPAGTVGMRTYVTDALAPSFGVAVAGSGAVTIPVFYDGANWIVA
jgi:hypothetical protein